MHSLLAWLVPAKWIVAFMVYDELLYKKKGIWGGKWQDRPLWPCSISPSCHEFLKPKHKASWWNALKGVKLLLNVQHSEGNESEMRQLHFLSVQL